MKKVIILTVLILCFMAAFTKAQLPKASDYFPLQVGNVWEYDHPYQEQFQLFTVIGDTLIEDSVRVFVVERKLKLGGAPWEMSTPFFYHYNADTTVVYRDMEFPQTPYTGLPMIDTGHGVGHRWVYLIGDCYCTFSVTDTGSCFFFNQVLPWIDVSIINPEYDSLVIENDLWRFIVGVGITKEGLDKLVYAKINGIEYGNLVNVKAEKNHRCATPSEFDLKVYPNPVSSFSNISINGLSRGLLKIIVVDVLGRTVRTLTNQYNLSISNKTFWDGRDDKGSFLPSGIYFVVVRNIYSVKTHKIIYLR